MAAKGRTIWAGARAALSVAVSLALAAALVPALPARPAAAAAATLYIGAPDASSDHRYNSSAATTNPGYKERLVAELDGDGVEIVSVAWTLSRAGVVELSAESGPETGVTTLANEGWVTLTCMAACSDGVTRSNSATYSVYTPTERCEATATGAATMTRGASDDNAQRWAVGTVRRGQAMTVVGTCGDRYRVEMPPGYAFSDKAWSGAAYIDKSKVDITLKGITISGVPDDPVANDISYLKAFPVPSMASLDGLHWSSSDRDVAIIGTASGKMTLLKAGKVTIIAESGNVSESVSLSVRRPWARLSMSRSGTISMRKDTELKISARVVTERVLKEKNRITWRSSDESVATVTRKGKVSAFFPGRATITATARYGGSKSVDVVVTEAPKAKASKPNKRKTKPKVGSRTARSVSLSWSRVKKAKRYVVQVRVKVKGKSRWLKAAKTKKAGVTVTRYKRRGRWVALEPGKTYAIRVVPYKRRGGRLVPVGGKGGSKKLTRGNKVTVTTLTEAQAAEAARAADAARVAATGDPQDLGAAYIYAFSNILPNFFALDAAGKVIPNTTNMQYYNPDRLFAVDTKDVSGKYYLGWEEYNKAIDYLINVKSYSREDAIRLVNLETVSSQQDWGGSCFGMSYTVALNVLKDIDVCRLVGQGAYGNDSVGMLGELDAPKDFLKLQSVINYYQVMQLYTKEDHYCETPRDLASFLLDENSSKKIRTLGFSGEFPKFDKYGNYVLDSNGDHKTEWSAHRVVLHKGYSVEKDDDAVCYKFRLYDPNYPNDDNYLWLYDTGSGWSYSIDNYEDVALSLSVRCADDTSSFDLFNLR